MASFAKMMNNAKGAASSGLNTFVPNALIATGLSFLGGMWWRNRQYGIERLRSKEMNHERETEEKYEAAFVKARMAAGIYVNPALEAYEIGLKQMGNTFNHNPNMKVEVTGKPLAPRAKAADK